LRAQRVACVEPVVCCQQRQSVALSAARLRGQADVDARRFLVFAAQRQSFGAGFGGTAGNADDGGFAGAHHESQ
jgi:hypothetical protein